MYKTILVETDLEQGRRIVEELGKRQVRITAAFWYHYEDEDDWKLVVVSPDFEDQGPRALYTMISQMLSELSSDPKRALQFPLDRIMLVSPYSLLYKMVRDYSGLRYGPVREGPALDSYIYKMS
jgi:hypothetical protein